MTNEEKELVATLRDLEQRGTWMGSMPAEDVGRIAGKAASTLERLSAIEQEPIGYVTEAAAKLMREAKPGWHYHVIAADRSDKSATVAIYAGLLRALLHEGQG